MPTITEACRILRVSRHTLGKWCEKLGITPTQNELDGRFYELTEEQVERIRETLARRPAIMGSQNASRSFAYGGSTSLARSTPIPTYTPQAQQSDLALSASMFKLPNDPARSYTRKAARSSSSGLENRPLPAGWLPFGRWCESHGLNKRSVMRKMAARYLAMPLAEHAGAGEEWGSYSAEENRFYGVGSAYRADQLAEACQVAAEAWPDSYHPCADPACPCLKRGQAGD